MKNLQRSASRENCKKSMNRLPSQKLISRLEIFIQRQIDYAAVCVSRLRAAPTTVVTGSDFEMTEDTPSREACCSTYLSPKALYIISRTPGIKRFSTRAASRPFITGIDMSKTIKSGRNCWAFSIASRPFSASPHISKSSSRSNISHSALRMKALSSTIKIDLTIWVPFLGNTEMPDIETRFAFVHTGVQELSRWPRGLHFGGNLA